MNSNCQNLCHSLRLLGMHESLERRAAQSVAENLHPLEFLQLLLEDEKLYRQNRTAKMLKTKAKFRHQASLEEWDFSKERGLSRTKAKDLGCLGFLGNRENLIINGKTGLGKTHLAIALGQRICQQSLKVKFFAFNYLFEEALAEKASGRYHNWVRTLSKQQCLILDDFGLRNYTHSEATILIDILEERKGVLIVTSQVEPKGWGELFEDPVVGEAVIDRIVSPSQKVVLKGQSYRPHLKGPTPVALDGEKT